MRRFVRYETRPPGGPLRPFVRCLWRLRAAPGELRPQSIVPDGSFELLIHLGEPVRDDGAAEGGGPARVAATLTRPVRVEAPGALDVVGVRFRPGAAYPFLAVAAAELVDLVAPAGDVLPRELARVVEGLEPAATGPLFARLEGALRRRLQVAGHDPGFDVLAAALAAGRGQGSVGALADAAGLSPRQLERRFRARAGTPPKLLQRVLRFHRVATRILEGGAGLADLAAEAGYSDQAHMSREFRALAGTTPGSFRRQERPLDRCFAG
jgi:AraC-like DNA-binding protein